VKYSEMETWLWDQAAAAAAWYAGQSRDPYERWYLYHNTKQGGLCVGTESGPSIEDGWILSDAVRIPISWTKDQVARWIVEKAKRLPCLPPEKAGAS